MDSYTDVRGQCCGCRRSCPCNCNASNKVTTVPCMQPEYPDMTTPPWPAWDNMGTFPFPAAPVTQPANMSCPHTEPGCLEQQFSLAMAYVPWQQWQTTYAPERGLVQGTIFPELDLQFSYGGCSR